MNKKRKKEWTIEGLTQLRNITNIDYLQFRLKELLGENEK